MDRRIKIAAEIAKLQPNKEVSVFYVAAVQRFILTLGFFILGMGVLALPPVPMIVTFGIAQIGYFFKGN
jgi:ATP synthase protein I